MDATQRKVLVDNTRLVIEAAIGIEYDPVCKKDRGLVLYSQAVKAALNMWLDFERDVAQDQARIVTK